jgi:hypothetical protein
MKCTAWGLNTAWGSDTAARIEGNPERPRWFHVHENLETSQDSQHATNQLHVAPFTGATKAF